MTQNIDPKELKTLSDILALVLEDQPGQAASALEAIRMRARRNAVTGGALKNLFVAIAPNPPAPRAAPRPRARSTASPELAAARTRISQLTADVGKLDLDLRGATARIEALRGELNLTRKARAEAQQQLSKVSRDSRPKTILMVLCLACGVLLGIAGTSMFHELDATPHTDRAGILNQP